MHPLLGGPLNHKNHLSVCRFDPMGRIGSSWTPCGPISIDHCLSKGMWVMGSPYNCQTKNEMRPTTLIPSSQKVNSFTWVISYKLPIFITKRKDSHKTSNLCMESMWEKKLKAKQAVSSDVKKTNISSFLLPLHVSLDFMQIELPIWDN